MREAKSARRSRFHDFLFFSFVGTFYVWALSESILTSTVLDLPFWQTLAYAYVFVLAFGLMFYNKYTTLGALGFFLLAGGGVFLFLYLRDFDVAWFVYFRELAGDLHAFAFSTGPYREEFAALAAWGISCLFAFVTVLNTRLHFGFFSLTLMALGVIAYPIYAGWDASEPAILVALFCLLALLAKRLYLNTAQLGGAEPGSAASRYTLALIPLCLLLFGAGWALPKPDAETVENMSLPDVGGAMETFLNAVSPEQTLSFTENGSRLGGPAELNDLVVMIVEADERLYLAGATRDYYTGDAWLSTDRARFPIQPGEDGVFPTDIAPEGLRAAQNHFRNYYGWPIREVTVTTGDVRTDVIFTPPFHQTLALEEDLALTQNNYGNLRVSRPLPRGAGYTQSYIAWDRESPFFSHILREASIHSAGAQELGGRVDAERVQIIQELSALSARGNPGLVQFELEPFLQLPDSLPGRVRDLAVELTADSPTDYDRLRALEGFLASFPYTLEAPPLPPGEDFVDHFLFTGQEGYCVHYATAMVVMARTLGIPARYVEGYVTPEFPAADGRFWVTNRQAHAWVEAYIHGFGWVPFEPTATYNLGWGDTAIPIEWEARPEPQQPGREPAPPPAGDPAEDSPAAPENAEKGEAGGFPWGLLVLVAALPAGGWLAYRRLTARYRARQRKLDALPNRDAVLALFASTLNAAGTGGCPIARGETALAYADRASGDPLFSGGDLRQLAGIYSKAAYSAHEVTAWERAAAHKGRDDILRRLVSSKKKLPRYWLDRYILLRY